MNMPMFQNSLECCESLGSEAGRWSAPVLQGQHQVVRHARSWTSGYGCHPMLPANLQTEQTSRNTFHRQRVTFPARMARGAEPGRS
jgi:hypothetical protein